MLHSAVAVRFDAGIVSGNAGDQPANEKPSRAGSAGGVTALAYAFVIGATFEPPAASNAISYQRFVHCAVAVTSEDGIVGGRPDQPANP